MRANIYTLEPLAKEVRESIHYGIEMVAGYIGEVVVAKEKTIRLPQDNKGLVNPRLVGLGGLDKLTELHLMAVPLSYDQPNCLGLAATSAGFTYVDSVKCDTPDLARVISAHETAHALGFVQKGAKHEDPTSPHHCTTPNCLMEPLVKVHRPIDLPIDMKQFFGNQKDHPLFDNFKSYIDYAGLNEPAKPQIAQSHFCHCCQQEMKTDGSKNLSKLRHFRLNTPKNVKLTF